MRSKRLLDEKHYEAGRLRDEASKKHEGCLDLSDQIKEMERELDMLKGQQSENYREM